jgi:hypothetical protein
LVVVLSSVISAVIGVFGLLVAERERKKRGPQTFGAG